MKCAICYKHIDAESESINKLGDVVHTKCDEIMERKITQAILDTISERGR